MKTKTEELKQWSESLDNANLIEFFEQKCYQWGWHAKKPESGYDELKKEVIRRLEFYRNGGLDGK